MERLALPEAAFQPFSARDTTVMGGLLRRRAVQEDPLLCREAVAMRDAKIKVEIEEMHTFGFEYLAQLVLHKIINQCTGNLPSRCVGCCLPSSCD